MKAPGLMKFEEGLLKHLTDPQFCSAAESSDARKLSDMCFKWLSGQPAQAKVSPAEIWQAAVNVLETPLVAERAAGKPGTAGLATLSSRMVAVVTRTKCVVHLDTARAADFVLVLARLFASSAAYEEAAKACLYAVETCPCLLAELTGITIPDHAPPDAKVEQWRDTDFAKTVDTLLDSATRAKLSLGRELGEALVRHRAGRQFENSVADGKHGATGVVHYNVRGASCRASTGLCVSRFLHVRSVEKYVGKVQY